MLDDVEKAPSSRDKGSERTKQPHPDVETLIVAGAR